MDPTLRPHPTRTHLHHQGVAHSELCTSTKRNRRCSDTGRPGFPGSSAGRGGRPTSGKLASRQESSSLCEQRTFVHETDETMGGQTLFVCLLAYLFSGWLVCLVVWWLDFWLVGWLIADIWLPALKYMLTYM